MAPTGTGNCFDDSDDDDGNAGKKGGKKEKKKSGADDDGGDGENFQYDGSLVLKSGKTPIYYVDHTKTKNNGDGLEPEAKMELEMAFQNAKHTENALKQHYSDVTAQKTKLLSEPTNAEAVELLENEESELKGLEEQVSAARGYKANEKRKLALKRGIAGMTAQWRKRRRICMDFLIAMEENTDGSVSVKKCIAGDGPIDIDSDENVASAAVEFAKKKMAKKTGMVSSKMRGSLKSAGSVVLSAATPSGLPMADEKFVAVVLDPHGLPKRVYVEDDALAE